MTPDRPIERWSAQLLDDADQVVGELPGVSDGSLEWSIFKPVAGSGSLTFADPLDLDVTWMTARIRILHHLGDTATPVGIWLPAIPEWGYDWPRRTATIELLDKTELLNRSPGRWVSAPTDVAATAWVRQMIQEGTGETAAIGDSDTRLATPQVFDPLESTWLQILNAVLAAIGYTTLSATWSGVLTASRYLAPAERSPVGTYGGQPGDLRMRPEFSDVAGVFDVPNTVTVIAPATDTKPALIGTAINDDPSSPFAVSLVGVRPHVEEGEAATQEAADALATRRLQELSQITRRITWQHPMDISRLDDAVDFRPLGERLALVQRSISLGVGAVVETTGRRIYTGGESPWG